MPNLARGPIRGDKGNISAESTTPLLPSIHPGSQCWDYFIAVGYMRSIECTSGYLLYFTFARHVYCLPHLQVHVWWTG